MIRPVHTLFHGVCSFAWAINKWAVEKDIRDRNGKLWRFQPHQFRRTVSICLINEDVPLEVISPLLGHRSLTMTQVYARIKDKKCVRISNVPPERAKHEMKRWQHYGGTTPSCEHN